MHTFRAGISIACFCVFALLVLPTRVAGAERTCEELRVVSGNNRFVPSTVTFAARVSEPVSSYTFYFGDGQKETSMSPEIHHTYDVSGTYTVRVGVDNSSCQVIFSLLSSPLESQKSGCGDVFILGQNYAPVGSDIRFLVTGYDNKSGIKEYKIDFGNGQVKQGNVGSFNQTFTAPGTYTVKGYVVDSKSVEKGGDGSCKVPLYITGEPIETQPDTETPAWFTGGALLSGICLFLIARKNYLHR